jgi:hypothetical protein
MGKTINFKAKYDHRAELLRKDNAEFKAALQNFSIRNDEWNGNYFDLEKKLAVSK